MDEHFSARRRHIYGTLWMNTFLRAVDSCPTTRRKVFIHKVFIFKGWGLKLKNVISR